MSAPLQPVTTALDFFPAHELACKGTGVIKMHPTFAAELPKFRRAWGKPIVPNSVCRTPAHNAAVGGHPSSLHLTENPKWPTVGAMAIDCPWRGWPATEQLRFARLAWAMGWSVGLHNGFCHLDRRADLGLRELPQHVFLYGQWDWRFAPADVRRP